MRIVYFDFTNNFGGAPQGVVHLAVRLSVRHEVHIIDAYGRCEPYIQAIIEAKLPHHVLQPEAKHIYIGGSGLGRAASLIKQTPELNSLRLLLASEVLKINPDVIWVMNEKSLMLVALNECLRCYPTAIYIQGWGTPDQVGWRLRWLMRHRAKAVIAVSTATEDQLCKAGVTREKLFLGSMTIDFNKVKDLSQKPPVMPLPAEGFSPKLLILAARPEQAKGHTVAFKAIARLKLAGYKPSLWMTGKIAIGHQDAFIDKLQRLAEQLDIVENIFFLGWQDNIPAVIQAADICILPSHTEGLPRSILESMVLGKPVIATPVGGIGDAIKDGRTGFLMPIDDDEVLANLVLQFVKNPLLKEKIITNASDFVMKHFNPEVHTAGIEKILHKITE